MTPIYTIAVDPGIRGCGIAVFQDKSLRRAAYVENDVSGSGLAWTVDGMQSAVLDWISNELEPEAQKYWIAECPQIYQGGKQKGDPNDLIALALVIGGLPCARYYKPSEWKGQVPKDITLKRIKAKLFSEELKTIDLAGAKSHNIFDAIGIGLFHLGRL